MKLCFTCALKCVSSNIKNYKKMRGTDGVIKFYLFIKWVCLVCAH